MATVTFYSSSFANNLGTGTRTITGVSWEANSVLVAMGIGENQDGVVAVPTNVNITFANTVPNVPQSDEVTMNGCVAFATDARTSQTITMTSTGGSATNNGEGFGLWVITPDPGYILSLGNTFRNFNESATSLAVLDNSIMCWALGDWSANNTTQTLTTGSGASTKRLDSTLGGAYSWVYGDWKPTAATTTTWGVTSYTGITRATQIGIEIRETLLVDPYIASVVETPISTAGTSHTVVLPSGLESTDEILLICDIGSTSATINSLTNWDEVLDEASANGLKIIRWTGSGTPTNPTFTLSSSTRGAWLAFRIIGADKSITPQIGTTATGTSTSPNPPSVTPSGGTKNYLVIPFFGMAGEEADDNTWVNSPPSGYGPSIPYQLACGTAGTNLGGLIGAAALNINTGSAIGPGTFSVDVSAAWRAQTIVIHPLIPSSGHPIKLKASGTFTTAPLKLRASGTFTEFPTKLKASGVFTP